VSSSLFQTFSAIGLFSVIVAQQASGQACARPIEIGDVRERFTYAPSVSGDGLTVVGGTHVPDAPDTPANPRWPFRWTAASGFQLLPLPPGAQGRATAASHDGRLIVGYLSFSAVGPQYGAIWRDDDQPDLLLVNERTPYFTDVSDDGETIIGGYQEPIDGATTLARVFRLINGRVADILSAPLPQENIFPTAISADGECVVGSITAPTGIRPFRWTRESGVVDLGSLGGNAYARDVSGDGRTVVGFAMNPSGANVAFRWTPEAGLQSLESLGGRASSAEAVSQDGQIIVGTSSDSSGRFFPVRWVDSRLEVLAYPDVVPNSRFAQATSVSADGSVISGSIARDSSQVATFRWTTLGSADVNRDGFVDFFDFDDFVLAFESGDPAADFNRDSLTDFFDFDDFIFAFENGC
jgi:uncharacterized membrane protein